MIRITVELIPHGDEKKAETIAVGTIANNSNGNIMHGSYDATFDETDVDDIRMNTRKCEVKKYKRFQDSIWTLIRMALKNAEY